MDPVTQGVVGALFAQTRGAQHTLAKAAVIGALAGMAPDLDVLIRSSSDPLLALEFHRQFTHSLFFIPFGGWLCSLLLYPLLGKRWQLSYRQVLLWCLIGFATHALLDGCTTYGTKLLWPFSEQRFAWDVISVVDPLFTLPLLLLVGCAAWFKSRVYLKWALLWGALYLALGVVQHQRAIALGHTLAHSRGHQVLRLEAKPSFANLVVWKVVYEANGYFYVDAVKPGLRQSQVWHGDRVQKLELQRDFPWLNPASQQARDVARFAETSAGYLAVDPRDPLRIGDVRYAMLPQSIAPLWGIQLALQADLDTHVAFYSIREDAQGALKRIVHMVFE